MFFCDSQSSHQFRTRICGTYFGKRALFFEMEKSFPCSRLNRTGRYSFSSRGNLLRVLKVESIKSKERGYFSVKDDRLAVERGTSYSSVETPVSSVAKANSETNSLISASIGDKRQFWRRAALSPRIHCCCTPLTKRAKPVDWFKPWACLRHEGMAAP